MLSIPFALQPFLHKSSCHPSTLKCNEGAMSNYREPAFGLTSAMCICRQSAKSGPSILVIRDGGRHVFAASAQKAGRWHPGTMAQGRALSSKYRSANCLGIQLRTWSVGFERTERDALLDSLGGSPPSGYLGICSAVSMHSIT